MSALQLETRADSVAVLTIDQPGSKANVLNAALWTELEAVLDSLMSRTDLRGLVLASAKPGIFIAGADLNVLASAAGPGDPAVRGFIEQGLRVLEKLESLPFPTCAAIDGAALGGGLEVALACDYRVCGTSEKVKIGLPEVTLGLIPGWGGTQRLPRVAGMERAAEMLTTGASLSAESASKKQEFVWEVFESSTLVDRVARWLIEMLNARIETEERCHFPPNGTQSLIRSWMKKPPRKIPMPLSLPPGLTGAAAEAIRVMVEGATLPLYEGIKLETEAFMRLAGSDEPKRLIAAFFASRKK